ncbi:MAG: hypothetical protein MZV70_73260 [Desulfobacterales bacterium]|nr:hypothetical protein [Desulfobacterales bacterium]
MIQHYRMQPKMVSTFNHSSGIHAWRPPCSPFMEKDSEYARRASCGMILVRRHVSDHRGKGGQQQWTTPALPRDIKEAHTSCATSIERLATLEVVQDFAGRQDDIAS